VGPYELRFSHPDYFPVVLPVTVAPGSLVNVNVALTRNTTGLGEEPATAWSGRMRLGQNRPNPFRGETLIPYSLPEDRRVQIGIFDAGGRLIRILRDGEAPAGSRDVTWDGRDSKGAPAPAGLYFCRMHSDHGSIRRAMLLLR
jgi:hypothetical protein